jgi:NADH-ubiquinone oxidoreductase chain 2
LHQQFKIIEYPLILLFVIAGATFLISSSDIVSIFISIELQSYGLYLLATLYRNSELSTSAGLTYFLLGGMSSCFILLGTALLYTNSGSTNLESFYIINNIWEISEYNIISIFQNTYINYALIIMTVGFLFKISAAPFHFWSPDVYDAIPTIVTTFVAIIAKISILVFLFEVVHYTSSYGFNNDLDWRYILLLSSLLSLIVGTVLGLNQFRIKRLFAYSTISHLGFILLSLSINTVESIQAFIFYLIQYSISNLNAFIILVSIGYTLYIYSSKREENDLLLDKNNSPVQLISQLKGYFYINPLLAISLAITIYSFVGVPPLLGFFGKQMVLSAALDNGFVFLSLVAILTSVISAVYYLNIIKNIFFEKSDYIIYKDYNKQDQFIKLSSAFSISISVITLLILGFLLLQQDILNLTNLVSIYIFNI